VEIEVKIYDYDDFICSFFVERAPKVGDRVRVDFDDPNTKHITSEWRKLTGTYFFPIHYYDGEIPISQLAITTEEY